MLVHPYTAEIYTWRLAMVAFSVALLSISVTLEMVRASRGIATTVAAAIIVVLGLLTYQVVLNFLVTVLVCSTVIVCLLRVSGRHRDRLRVHETRTIDLAKVLALSVLIYSIVTYSLGHVLHVTADGRANLIPLSGAIERFDLLLRTLTFVFWRTEIIFPKWLKCLQLLFILAVPVSLGLFSKWRRLNVTYLRRLVLLMMVSTCLVPSSLGVIIFFDNWWPVPRAISHVAVIIGVLYWLPLYYGYIEQQGMNRVQSAIRVVLGIFVVGCIGVHTRIFADQRRMNAWDAAMGNRIISRLEILPNFGNIEAVHFVGSFYRYPSGPYTIQGDMNISSLGLIGLNTYVLNMVSGYHWRTATSEERIQAQALCQRSEKWPAPTSVMIVDKMAVVCLPTAG
ncbi:MAG: hypothetical protein EOO61_09540 [Hymenobacter sp.]|nr:MAG: hypothetical protein EOO61_09540 [Hymenobacter sp.]